MSSLGYIMLLYYSQTLCKGILWFTLIILVCTGYAYVVNARRDASDPKKREYTPYAILIAPITLPLLLMLAVVIFIIRALLFLLFLVVFTVALIAIRKPFIFVWLNKIALQIGEPLLKINTHIIRLAFSPWLMNSEPA